MCRKIFQFTAFAFLENALNLCIFTHATVPPLKTLGRIFGKSVSPKNEGVYIGSYDLLYQNSIGKYEDDLEH